MALDPVQLIWFRQDLRLADNPALCAAATAGRLLPVYILDDVNAPPWRMGAASRVWLHHALHSLNASLSGQLRIFTGDPLQILPRLCAQHSVQAVHWSRCYEPWRTKRDRQIEAALSRAGIAVHTHNGSLLWEPWEVLKADGAPYRVFTPYFRRGCLQAPPPRPPLKIPPLRIARRTCTGGMEAATSEDLRLLPDKPWHTAVVADWQISEAGAQAALAAFLQRGLPRYRQGRDRPAEQATSRLSPYLHFGQLSPNQVWYAVHGRGADPNLEHFASELGWREFSYSLLYHFPALPEQCLQAKFERFPWGQDPARLKAWQRGQTGHPLVDAGMRELWQTGTMHNRVRMVVASFLVKNLLLDWRCGARWFWDCLFDADLANNSASWQWVAGCGADAAPYFRIFNPITQGEKFDPDGQYTRRYLPELARLPAKYLYKPWAAPPPVLCAANIRLGEDYPHPLVDIQPSRQRALAAFSAL
ncbi:MAG: deoxyribodipyrimidine photo-lyase [Cellvibrionales bacterium]|nr:deoxyribodipyrimidine photo-lyase [Cellvibrionales bacterium]